MAAESFSSLLNFTEMKRRGVASKNMKIRVQPQNGATFTSGNGTPIRVALPGNMANRYYDLGTMYLKWTVSSNVDCRWDRAGCYGLIKRVTCSTSGAVISDLNEFGLLATAMMDTEASAEWKASSGNVLVGTLGDTLQGDAITAGAGNAVTYCMPIVLTSLAMTTPSRLIPAFSKAELIFDFYLDQGAIAVKAADAATLTVTNVEMVCNILELSPAAQAELMQRTQGQFSFLANSWTSYRSNVPAAATAHSFPLGISVSSLERLLIIHRPAGTAAAQTAFSLGNRTPGTLSQFQVLINSEMYPNAPVRINEKGSEALAELLISSHSLGDFRLGNTLLNGVTAPADLSGEPVGMALGGGNPTLVKTSAFNVSGGAGTSAGTPTHCLIGGVGAPAAAIGAASNIGTFLCGLDLENSISRLSSSHVYTGISTIASTVNLNLQYGAVPAGGLVLDVFACSSIIVGLNLMGSGLFQVAV